MERPVYDYDVVPVPGKANHFVTIPAQPERRSPEFYDERGRLTVVENEKRIDIRV